MSGWGRGDGEDTGGASGSQGPGREWEQSGWQWGTAEWRDPRWWWVRPPPPAQHPSHRPPVGGKDDTDPLWGREEMGGRHPQWAVLPEGVLKVPFPFRVKELPEDMMQEWKRRATEDFGLEGFSIRAGRKADWRVAETSSTGQPKGMLTLLGDRAVAFDCLREFLLALGDAFYGQDAQHQFDAMFEEEFVPEAPAENEEVVVEHRLGSPHASKINHKFNCFVY